VDFFADEATFYFYYTPVTAFLITTLELSQDVGDRLKNPKSEAGSIQLSEL
jgi:hypothetical protein